MKLIKFLKSLFAASSMPASTTPTQVPPPAPPESPAKPEVKVEVKKPEPSCLIQGVVRAWIDRNDEWTISRSKIRLEKPTSTWGYRRVLLTHKRLGLMIALHESEPYPLATVQEVFVGGKKMAYRYVFESEVYYSGFEDVNLDVDFVEAQIKKHPYPALKRRLDKKVKDDATRAARLKEIETLGCPNPESPKTREMISKVIQTSPANEGRYFELEGEQNP